MKAQSLSSRQESRTCTAATAQRFGYEVLGPIFAEFAQRLWMFQQFVPGPEDACLLFCARGGLRLRLIYETFLSRTGLQSRVPYGDLMISRLVAARTSVAALGPTLLEELGREFHGQTMAEVAAALTQDCSVKLGPEWNRPFDRTEFVALLQSNTADVACLKQVIARLNDAFYRHLGAISGGRSTIILCDTGLYGSTLRLMQESTPEKRWFAVQFARCNYKGFATPHFDATVGLSVERDGYTPWNARTTVLRFWQLIESVLEPDLESVRTFTDEAFPRANLQVPGWQERIGPETQSLFGGVMDYLQALSPAHLPAVPLRAERAWRSLRGFVIWPRLRDLPILTLPPRGRDFGRTEAVQQFPQNAPILTSLWREGALVQRYPHMGRLGLLLLEAAHTGRTMRKLAKRWSRRRVA